MAGTMQETVAGTDVFSETEFGASLRYWRNRCRMSQAMLVNRSGLSGRHLSFLESGRAKPSVDSILKLSEVLALPLKSINSLLVAAGFAPRFKQSPLQHEELKFVSRALQKIMEQQQPYPGVVMSPIGDIEMTNDSTLKIFEYFCSQEALLSFTNAYELFFSDAGLKPYIVNFDALAGNVLRLVEQEINHTKSGYLAREKYDKLLSLAECDIRQLQQLPTRDALPIFHIHLRKNETELRFFSTYTSFGTPYDVSLQELRIETFFPSDKTTEIFCQRLNA